MPKSLSAYRVYASTLSSFENLPYAKLEKEIHIVLAFARDYDAQGKYQTGKFFPYFDTSRITAEEIQNIKDRATSTSVKFFLSIGGRDSEFPFDVTSAQQTDWITNATQSLKEIVQNYKIDGIDVYYEHIKSDAVRQFANSIQKVIWSLKRDNIITDASITVSAPLNKNYDDLYKKNEKVFDYVVYQSHTELSPISTFQELVAIFDKLPYPKGKILAGYSLCPDDWTTVPPPIFFGAIPQLLDMELFAISMWIADHKPEA